MRVAVAQQVVHDVVAHDDVVGGVVFVGGGKAAAQGDVDVVQREHGPGIAAHVGVVAGVAVVDDVGGLRGSAPTSLHSVQSSRMA